MRFEILTKGSLSLTKNEDRLCKLSNHCVTIFPDEAERIHRVCERIYFLCQVLYVQGSQRGVFL